MTEHREQLERRDCEIARLRKALSNIMQYLYDTDELGEEYLTPMAKKHYEEAHEALKEKKK